VYLAAAPILLLPFRQIPGFLLETIKAHVNSGNGKVCTTLNLLEVQFDLFRKHHVGFIRRLPSLYPLWQSVAKGMYILPAMGALTGRFERPFACSSLALESPFSQFHWSETTVQEFSFKQTTEQSTESYT
jgi:hypothetical protein